MEQSLLSPQDGAPRTSWYLGEGFWGGLLADEDLETPVATLARRRKNVAADGGKASGVRGGRKSARTARKRTDGDSQRERGRWYGKPNQWVQRARRQTEGAVHWYRKPNQ